MKLEKLIANEDRRGTLVEAFKMPHDGQVFYVMAEAGETRGNHYHLRKTEHFVVVFGVAEIQSKDRETGNIMKVELSGDSPMVVTIPPNSTHNFYSEKGAIFLVWCDEQFDPDDPDTYPEEI